MLFGLKLYYKSFILFVAIGFIYYFTLELFTNQTVGKMITRTYVCHKDVVTNKNEIAMAIFRRTVSRMLIIEVFWYIRKRPIGFHDTVSNTLTVDKDTLK